jgi:hypothetical protein
MGFYLRHCKKKLWAGLVNVDMQLLSTAGEESSEEDSEDGDEAAAKTYVWDPQTFREKLGNWPWEHGLSQQTQHHVNITTPLGPIASLNLETVGRLRLKAGYVVSILDHIARCLNDREIGSLEALEWILAR